MFDFLSNQFKFTTSLETVLVEAHRMSKDRIMPVSKGTDRVMYAAVAAVIIFGVVMLYRKNQH